MMKQITRFAAALVISLLLSVVVFGQTIKGSVKDSTGTAVPFASVNLKDTATKSIIAYAITDAKGVYSLQVQTGKAIMNLIIEVRCIGFEKQERPIAGFDVPVDFTLSRSVTQLKSVTVRNNRPVLRTNGDTLGYRVSDFASPQDRTIGDVIKRLPGISIAADGTISFNNKPISALYIGGDNLLDDKYSIATNSIPQGSVSQVQVIQNDQPIKVLQHKVMSDDVALNLDIKKNAKLHAVGQESIGGGLPGNYDVTLNAMMFKDNYKAINYLAGNNIGNDAQRDVVSHNKSDYNLRIDNALPQTLLSGGTANTPALEQSRYLFNQSGVLNVNNLINLQRKVQLRVNAYYVHDTQHQDYNQQTTYFLPGDTVKYDETQHSRTVPNIFHAQFTLNMNKEKYYLNDVLLMDNNNTNTYSALKSDTSAVTQVLKDHSMNFSNEFNLIKSLKSNSFIQIYSYVSHSTEPESLGIAPGYNASIFNNDQPYAQLLQHVNVPTWYTNNSFSFGIPSNLITQSFRTGFSIQSQSLTSDLNVVQNDKSVDPWSNKSLNRVDWMRKKFYAEAKYDLPGTILQANLTLPVTLQQISYSDSSYSLNKSLTRLYFNPKFGLKYKVGAENFVNLHYGYSNQIGTIENIYPAYILTNYRTLLANNANLIEQQMQEAGAGFSYLKALTLFAWNINALYTRTAANNISSSVITNNLQESLVLPYHNSTDSWTVSGTISKYSFPLRTTFSSVIQWQTTRSVQIQNNTLLPFNTISESCNVSTDTKVSGAVSFSYKATLMQTSSHSIVDASANKIDKLTQEAAVNYHPIAALQFNLSGEHYFTRQQGNPDLKYFFADASVRLGVSKWKFTTFEISAVNFLNLKTYNARNLSANTLNSSSYTLPGRIVMFRMMFNL